MAAVAPASSAEPPVTTTVAAAVAWQPLTSLASGAHPTSTFPNSHLLAPMVVSAARGAPRAAPTWCAPEAGSALEALRRAVREEDWERHFEEGRTRISMRAEWSANEERCELLQLLAGTSGARRVLEIGSFCGAGALALAEALPEDGEVLSLELDGFAMDFGRRYQLHSLAGGKIRSIIGPAASSLADMARKVRMEHVAPFDMVVVDADKRGMRQYFDLVMNTPGFLSDRAVVCVDTTAFKGQPPTRYLKYGFPYRWEASSGQEHIDALRSAVHDSEDLIAHEFGHLLIVRRA